MTTQTAETLARRLYDALVGEARRNAAYWPEHQLLRRVDAMRPAEALDAFAGEQFISADLLTAVTGVLRHLAPADYGDQEAAAELSEHDFMELLAFSARCESADFCDVRADAPPKFESPGLQTLAQRPSGLEELLDRHEEAISAFFRQPDAAERLSAYTEA
ncbi:hypothetical protein [Streptomyces europaeiscabiei]|uniref:hypothetical protein n=1 Tax=Streptomyces europaeiscabiei TaxID=146819 RepID=UPI0038F71E07